MQASPIPPTLRVPVTFCAPPVTHANVHLRTLNKDQVFARFVLKMRNEFKNIVNAELKEKSLS